MNKQIAAEIGIAETTVKIHRGNVMKKMGAKSLADLARMAEMLGIRRAKPSGAKPKYDCTSGFATHFPLGGCATASALYPRQEGPSCQRYRLFQSLMTMHPSAPRRAVF
jgi:hypothetical protein